jgi:uncharacterized protein DUF6798
MLQTSAAADREGKTLWARCKKQHWLAVLPALPILVAFYFYPAFLDNEAGKLIEARRILEPAFLGRDWLQAASGEDVLYRAFSSLIAPLWLLFRNAILVALTGRLLIWALLLYALVRLARALEIESYALAIGLAIWLLRFQSLGASEWIFGGIEGKCVSYALLFLALECALRKRVIASALYCGLAIWFHVLVGGWGAMALGGALLICHREYGWRRPLQFGAITGTFLLPLVVEYLRATSRGESGGSSAQADRLIVLFRNPHHLDPWFFHGMFEFALLCILVAITVCALYRLVSRSKAALISGFMVILLLQFGAGLAARSLGAFWFLKNYPFRVADVLVALLFWLTAPMLAVWISKHGMFSRGPSRFRALAWSALVAASVTVVVAKSLPLAKPQLTASAESWSRSLRHEQTPWREATQWIRLHTPASAVIIAPPWEGAFWIEAERAELVNFKRAPHSRAILEWQQRMVDLNGGPFHSRGFGMLDELQEHYPELDAARVEALGRSYGADYFLALRPLPELAGGLVYENGSYFLYQLKR